MGTIEVNDIIRITCKQMIDGVNEVVGVFHHKCLVTNTGDDDAFMAVVAIIFDGYYTDINPEITDRLSYINIEGQNVTADRLLPAKAWPVLTVGGTASEMLPETVAACVFFRSTRPKTRASKFFAGYTEASNVGGVLSVAAQNSLQDIGDALVLGYTANGASMQYGAYNAEFDRFTPVNVAIVPTRWRTQRRRRFGVGS